MSITRSALFAVAIDVTSAARDRSRDACEPSEGSRPTIGRFLRSARRAGTGERGAPDRARSFPRSPLRETDPPSRRTARPMFALLRAVTFALLAVVSSQKGTGDAPRAAIA